MKTYYVIQSLTKEYLVGYNDRGTFEQARKFRTEYTADKHLCKIDPHFDLDLEDIIEIKIKRNFT